MKTEKPSLMKIVKETGNEMRLPKLARVYLVVQDTSLTAYLFGMCFLR